MTSNSGPSPNFLNIDFNQDFFPSAIGDYVDFPVAQGAVTIATLYSSVIDTLSSSTAFNFLNSLTANLNIATNGTTGQTIRLGAYTGASVHCGNIDHQGNSINHATNAGGGTLNLSNNMTTGILNVGTSTTRSGTINIGNGVGATGTILIGSSTTPTTVGGTLLSTGLITATAGLTSSTGLITGANGILAGNTALHIISANFTIPSTINRDLYVFCNASGTAYTITLPARLINQYIRFRNFSGQILTITAPTTTPATAIYPSFSTVSFTTTWPSFANNTILTLYCDGTNWLGF